MQLVRIFTHLIISLPWPWLLSGKKRQIYRKILPVSQVIEVPLFCNMRRPFQVITGSEVNIRIQEPPSWSFKLLQQLLKQSQNQRIVQIIVGAGLPNTTPKTCCEKRWYQSNFLENCKSWIAQLQLFAKPASDLPGVGSTLQSNSCTSSTCTNQ